nr:MAG TPA: hypothetical protein [Caudoviricetes sp.]
MAWWVVARAQLGEEVPRAAKAEYRDELQRQNGG